MKIPGKIMQARPLSNTCYVILSEEEEPPLDTWSTEEHKRYHVLVRDYTPGSEFIYAHKRADNILEALLLFNNLDI